MVEKTRNPEGPLQAEEDGALHGEADILRQNEGIANIEPNRRSENRAPSSPSKAATRTKSPDNPAQK